MPAIEIKLDDAELQALGIRAQELWNAAIGERQELESRWERNRKFYLGDRDGTGSTPKHIPSYHFPLTGPKIDALTDNVVGTITSGRPMMRCVGAGKEEEADTASKVIQFFYDLSGFKRKLRQLCITSGITGVSIVRPRFEMVEKDTDVDAYTEGRYRYKSCGIAFDGIDPINFAVSTSKTTGICSTMMAGHRFYRTRAQVQALIESGEYHKMEIEQLMAGDPEAHQPVDSSLSKLTDAAPTPAEDPIELVEQVLKRTATPELKEKAKTAYVSITIQVSDGKVLRLKEYPDDEPTYTDLRLKPEEFGNFWPLSSVANLLQGLQIQYNDIQNFIKAGALFSAIKPILEKGSPSEGAQPYYPGERIQIIGDVLPYTFEFDPGPLFEILTQIERQADAVIGISQAGTAQEFKADTTATEVANIQSNQATRLGGYVEEFSGGLERLTKIVQQILARNIEEWYPVYADELPTMPMEQMKAILERPWRWFSSARGAGDAPGAIMAKTDRLLALNAQLGPQPEQIKMALMQGLAPVLQQTGLPPEVLEQAVDAALAQSPQLFDMKEVVRTVVTAMDLSNADAILKPLDEQEEAEQQRELGTNEEPDSGAGMEEVMSLLAPLAGAIPGPGDANGFGGEARPM